MEEVALGASEGEGDWTLAVKIAAASNAKTTPNKTSPVEDRDTFGVVDTGGDGGKAVPIVSETTSSP